MLSRLCVFLLLAAAVVVTGCRTETIVVTPTPEPMPTAAPTPTTPPTATPVRTPTATEASQIWTDHWVSFSKEPAVCNGKLRVEGQPRNGAIISYREGSRRGLPFVLYRQTDLPSHYGYSLERVNTIAEFLEPIRQGYKYIGMAKTDIIASTLRTGLDSFTLTARWPEWLPAPGKTALGISGYLPNQGQDIIRLIAVKRCETPTVDLTPTSTRIPTSTPSPTPTPAPTPSPTPTPAPTPSPTPTPAPTPSPTPTPAPTPVPTPTPRPPPTLPPTPTPTPTPTLLPLHNTQNTRWLARNHPVLYHQIQEFPWVQDGLTVGDADAVDQLLYIGVGDLANLKAVLSLP